MTNPNVFVLSSDSLNQAYFDEYLTDIADLIDGVEFTNAIATASDTNSAMPGLTAGVYSDSIPGWGLPDENGPRTITELLAEMGYECGLWTDNYLFGSKYNYATGFEAGNLGEPTWKKRAVNAIRNTPLDIKRGVLEWVYFKIFKQIGSRISAEESFYKTAETLHAGALNWLRSSSSNNYHCWIHYMDTHHPYEPPQRYLNETSFNQERGRAELGQLTRGAVKSNGTNLTKPELEDVRAAYSACCKYLKDEILVFLNTLLEEGHFDPDRDLLALTADHGECLSPEKLEMMGHVPPAFWDEIVRVPLLIATPEWEKRSVNQQVSLIDLMPTLVKLAGADVPESVEGVPRSTPAEMATQYSVFSSEWQAEGSETWQTYRGIRAASGWKLFGAHLKKRDTKVLSRVDDDDENIVYIGENEIDNETEAHTRWTELENRLTVRGPLLGQSSAESGTGDVVEEHLRDLGYVD